jgi:hypothetical protein
MPLRKGPINTGSTEPSTSTRDRIMIKTLLAAAALALTVISAQADDKVCRPYGYVTCSITGHCLNHCGEWEGPQGPEAAQLKQPVTKAQADPAVDYLKTLSAQGQENLFTVYAALALYSIECHQDLPLSTGRANERLADSDWKRYQAAYLRVEEVRKAMGNPSFCPYVRNLSGNLLKP